MSVIERIHFLIRKTVMSFYLWNTGLITEFSKWVMKLWVPPPLKLIWKFCIKLVLPRKQQFNLFAAKNSAHSVLPVLRQLGVKFGNRQTDKQTNSLTPYTGVCGNFLSVKCPASFPHFASQGDKENNWPNIALHIPRKSEFYRS